LVTGTLPRGGFDYFRMPMPASDMFNWYVAIEGARKYQIKCVHAWLKLNRFDDI